MCHRVRLPEMDVRIGVWCPNEAHNQWSLKPLQTQEDAWEKNQELVSGLRTALRKMGVHRAYAPNVVSASAHIIESALLKEHIRLGKNIVMCRNRHIPADGVFLKPGEAFMMSAAGCPIIIATAGEQMIVAHAGRDSLIDRGVIEGEPTRRNISVVHSIVEALIRRGAVPGGIKMRMLFSIPANMFKHDFNHEKYGSQNRALALFIDTWCRNGAIRRNGSMFLDLEKIFLAQAQMMGVRDAKALHSLAEYPVMAHTHDGKKNPTGPHGKEILRRNLIVIKRRS